MYIMQAPKKKWKEISISSGNSCLTNAEIHYAEDDNGAIIATGKCGDDITYTLYESGLLKLNGSGKITNYGYNKTPWYSYRSRIVRIQFIGSITDIGQYAFNDLSNLTEVTLSKTLKYIGMDAFHGCTSLPSITLPNSVTEIGDWAFCDCESLKYMIVPKSLKYVGWRTFQSCSRLSDIYYGGSPSDWDDISIDDYNGYFVAATIHYNSIGPSSSPVPMRVPDANGTLTASFDNLIPNQNYLVVVSKTNDTETMLDADNLLYIDEKTADASGKLVCSYQPRVKYENVVVKTIIQINDKPSIVTQPANVTVKNGESMTVSVKAKGTGLTYQWYFKKSGQTAFSAWSGRTHASETCTPNELQRVERPHTRQ